MHGRFVDRVLENITHAGLLSPVKGNLSSRVEIRCDQNFLYWAEFNLISDNSLNSNFFLLSQRKISKTAMRLSSALF